MKRDEKIEELKIGAIINDLWENIDQINIRIDKLGGVIKKLSKKDEEKI